MSFILKRVAILSIAATALTLTAACAAYAQSGRVVRRGPVYQSSQVQFDRGYREGVRAGERDLRSRDRYDYRDERAWQRADTRAFREGFERGYNEAYRRGGYVGRGGYGGYGRGPGDDGRYGRDDDRYGRDGRYGRSGYGNPAAEAGYEDGYRQGVDDARDGDRRDPVRAKRYREGDRGYDRRYGSRDDWKAAYRQAFIAGYDRGYREFR